MEETLDIQTTIYFVARLKDKLKELERPSIPLASTKAQLQLTFKRGIFYLDYYKIDRTFRGRNNCWISRPAIQPLFSYTNHTVICQ